MKALAIMTRIPMPYKTKTRLMSILSPYECAEIHKMFLKDIINTISEIDQTDIYLFYGDEGPIEIIEDIVNERIINYPQRGDNLGIRMKNIFSDLFNMGYENVILMGTDIPEVGKDDLNRAFSELEQKDLVFGPTLDGGYYLVGMKRLHGMIFDPGIRWGTPTVFGETLNLIKKHGIDVGLINYHEDIDTKEDLIAFRKRMEKGTSCENTRNYVIENIEEWLLCLKN